MLRLYWLKNLGKCYGRPEQAFARLGIGQRRRNLANPYEFNVIEQAKRWRIPKDLANPDFVAKAYSGECLVLTIKNRGLANPYILANAYSGELLRAQQSFTCTLPYSAMIAIEFYIYSIQSFNQTQLLRKNYNNQCSNNCADHNISASS